MPHNPTSHAATHVPTHPAHERPELPCLFHLSAEYNGDRADGVTHMDQMIRLYQQGAWQDNPLYMERTLAQAHTLAQLCGAPAAHSLYYSDVSLIKAGGAHSPKEQYRANVRASLPQHLSAFKQHTPTAVAVAGGEALSAFVEIVLPELIAAGCAPRVILGVRNPGAEGHRGSWRDWEPRYLNAARDLSGQLAATREGVAIFKLTSPGAQTPFRLERLERRARR